MMSPQKYKFGLGMSGGGSRGAAHVGALQAFEEAGLRPDVIAGTSAGGIVGALYASGKKPRDIMEFINGSSLLKAYRFSLPSNGLTPFTFLRNKLAEHIREDSFEALQIPLHVGTTNLETGKMVVFNSGKLFDIVQACGSIPILFKPVEINGEWYVDGGAMNNFPVQCIRDQVEVLVGINVMPTVPIVKKKVNGMMGVALRSIYLGIEMNSRPGRALCDILIEPKELYDYDVFRFRKTQEMFDIGYQHAKKAIPLIQDRLQNVV